MPEETPPVNSGPAGSTPAAPPAATPSVRQQWLELVQELKSLWPILVKRCSDVSGNHRKLGKKYLEAGMSSEAIIRFKFVTWLQPKDADGWAWLAKAYALDKDTHRAKQALIKAHKLQPNHPMIHEVQQLMHVSKTASPAPVANA